MNIKQLIKENYEIAKSKGFYPEDSKITDHLMGIVSEIGEGYEADRTNNSLKAKVPGFTIKDIADHITGDKIIEGFSKEKLNDYMDNILKGSIEDEITDILIRTLNLSAFMNIDIVSHLIVKSAYNKTREHLHGKQY